MILYKKLDRGIYLCNIIKIGVKSCLEVESWAVEEGLKYCIAENWLPLVLETDSLMDFNCLSRNWEISWRVSMKIHKINILRSHRGVQMQHIMREKNKVADYFAHLVFFFAGTKHINFHTFQQVPKQGRTLISLDA